MPAATLREHLLRIAHELGIQKAETLSDAVLDTLIIIEQQKRIDRLESVVQQLIRVARNETSDIPTL